MTDKRYTSGRADIYRAMRIFEQMRDRYPPDSKEYNDITEGLRALRRGQYLNEEQLKAMVLLGYTDPHTTGWLEDDFK
jgi:hypothetical protein